MIKQHRALTEQITELAKFSEKLPLINTDYSLATQVIDFIKEMLDPVFVSFIIFEIKTMRLVIDQISGRGFRRTQWPRIEFSHDVGQSILKGGEVLAMPNVDIEEYLIFYDEDQRNQCEFRIPFFIQEKFVGILSLGKKSSGYDYSIEEIDLLRILTNHTASVCFRFYSETNFKTEKVTQADKEKTYQPHIKVNRHDDDAEFIGLSAPIQHIREIITKVAKEDVPVLITGESGTGKEVIARAIHNLSMRSEKQLVTMNCAALPESLVESEMFGHEKGAFTGAVSDKKGKFEYAHESSLFLDEIGDMNLSAQSKLLRVLQDGTLQRVGGNKTLYSNARVIAATNKDLHTAIQEGTFREDLYYRINVVQIELPPLRERGDDIIILADHFVQYFSGMYNRHIHHLSDDFVNWLKTHSFPGNIRELRNTIERCVIMAAGPVLTTELLPSHGVPSSTPTTPPKQPTPVTKSAPDTSLKNLEKEHIVSVLEEVNYNKSQASRILGIARKTLREKMAKYGIE